MAELLIELFSEEIPARMQKDAADALKGHVLSQLSGSFPRVGEANAYVTPRRLALVVNDVPLEVPASREERRGPKVDAPEKAIEGFLNSVGLTRDQVSEIEDKKGRYLMAVIEKPGRATAGVIAEFMPEIIRSFPWPKSMRWGSGSLRWVRPLHSIICLLDGKVVEFDVDGIVSGGSTQGHRFLAPGKFRVKNFEDYKEKLAKAFVVLDAQDRQLDIATKVAAIAADKGLDLISDDALLAEVAGLVEWPVPLMGNIPAAFLDVPEEALISAIRTHQKYFSLRDKKTGKMAPHFVVVANTDKGSAAVVAGNERVLAARLSDTKFFWDQDLKTPLQDRLPALDKIVFHAKLGTVGERAKRLSKLAQALCKFIPDADAKQAAKAGELAKADLVSGMVGEFPDLQGIMGGHYARREGLGDGVADAIRDQYSPKGPGDAVPTAPVSMAVALTDKLDALVGFFGIDEKPTGSKDPFALRRAALGVVRIVLENKLRVPLNEAFELAGQPNDTGLLDFIADRLKVHLRERGLRHDLVTAVFALGQQDDLFSIVSRAEALQDFLSGPDGENLLAAYKRAGNIVAIESKKDKADYTGKVDAKLLSQAEEKSLYDQMQAIEGDVAKALADEDFSKAMSLIATLRTPVDAFFDKVTVNADDADVRANRLRLLSRLASALDQVADFSRIEG